MLVVKRLLQVGAVLIGLGVVVVLVGLVVLLTTDFNRYKGQVSAAASDATGRTFTIAGDLTIVPSLTPTLAAEGLRFANAPWGTRPDMVTAERVFISLAVLPLLKGEFHVNQVRLVGADVLLETDAEGHGNWTLASQAEPPPPPEQAPGPSPGDDASGKLPPIVLADLRIEDARLAYRDGNSGDTRTVRLHHLAVAMDRADAPLALDLAGDLDGVPVTLAGELGSLAAVLGNAAFPIALQGTVGPVRLSLDGSLAEPQTPAGIDLVASVEGTQLADLADLAKAATGTAPAIPALGPYRLRTRVAGTPAALSIPDLELRLGSAETLLLTVAGAVSDPLSLQGLALHLEAAAHDKALLSTLAGPEAATLVPLTASANVAGSLAALDLSDLSVTAAGSDLAGEVSLAPLAQPPAITAVLTSRQLDLRPFQQTGGDGADRTDKADGTAEDDDGQADGGLFPDDPLPLDGLKAANADVRWRIGKVVTGTATLTDTTVTLALKDGVLRLVPVTTGLSGGSLSAALTLDASQGDRAILDAKLDGTGFDLARLLAETPSAQTLTGGPVSLAVDLKGAGRSVHAIVGSLDGLFQVEVGEAVIANPYLDLIAGDVLNNILNLVDPFQDQQQSTTLQCGVVRLPIRNGVASVDKSIAIQTGKIAVVADGTLNLGAETLDLAVHPYALEGVTLSVGQIANLVRLQGSFLNPRIGANIESLGKTALSVGAALATQGGSLAAESLLGQFSRDPDPCATAMGRASTRPQPERATAPTPDKAAEAARQAVEERARAVEQDVRKEVEQRAREVIPEELRRVIPNPGGLLGNW